LVEGDAVDGAEDADSVSFSWILHSTPGRPTI